MNIQRLVPAALLVDYLALTAWACNAAGWDGIVSTVSGPAGIQMTAELVLFFGVAATFIHRDAKRRGRNAAGWAAGVMCSGIVGVLLYLIAIGGKEQNAERRADAFAPAVS